MKEYEKKLGKYSELIGTQTISISIADVLKADEEGTLRLRSERIEKEKVLEVLNYIRGDRRLKQCKKVHIALDRVEQVVNVSKRQVSVKALNKVIRKNIMDPEIANGKHTLKVMLYLEKWVDAESSNN